MNQSRVFFNVKSTKDTFPNPLEIRFGEGFANMCAFKDVRDRSVGVNFSELSQQQAIGSECQEMDIYDPLYNQVAIRFFRRSSIQAMIEVLNAALRDLPEG